jgi:hypothetical protein
MRNPRRLGGGVGAGRRPTTLFGGMLRCGSCGGAISAISARLYGCTVRKERGPSVCAGVFAPRRDVDARILSLLREELLSPAALAQVQRDVKDVIASAAEGRRGDAARLADKEAEIARLVDAIARFGMSEALESRLRAAERERDAFRAARNVDASSSRPSPETVATAYRRIIMDLKTCLEGDAARARAALQKLLGEIRVVAQGDEVWAEVETRADRLLLEAMGAGVSNRGCGGRI